MMKLTALFFAIASLYGQDPASQPQRCGRGVSETVLPNNVVIVAGNGETSATSSVVIQPANCSSAAQTIPIIGTQIVTTCTLDDGQMVVIATVGAGDDDISILDVRNGHLLAAFTGLDSAISPDGHWLIRRDFYPPQSQVKFSEEYLLYDLTKSAADNRAAGVTVYTESAKGRVIYPMVENGTPFEHSDLPEKQTHSFRDLTFHWASDSAAVLFADSVKESLSVVLITFQGTSTEAYVHPVSANAICLPGDQTAPDQKLLKLAQVGLGPEVNGDRLIDLQFQSYDEVACKPKAITVQMKDFTPVELEVPPPPPRRQESIQRQALPIPRR